MSENKKIAVILVFLMTAAFCTAGFARKEEVLQASKMIEIDTVTTVEKVVTLSERKMKEEEKRSIIEKKMEELVEAARIAEEQAEVERIAAEQAEDKRIAAEQAEAEAVASQAMAVPQDAQSLLASIIYCEAGNQPYEGQVAVGAVVMNRVRSGSFPNTIDEVIYQSGQFVPAMTGWLDEVRNTGAYTDIAMQAAADALAGINPVGDCLFFDQGGYGMQIGAHYFH